METGFENREVERARKRIKEIRSFYINLTLYCTIIPIIIAINLIFTPDFYWFYFSMAVGAWDCFFMLWQPLILYPF